MLDEQTMLEKMLQWRMARKLADQLEAELTQEALSHMNIGDKFFGNGVEISVRPGRGRYDYQAAVEALALPKDTIDKVVAIQTKQIVDWRAVYTGLSDGSNLKDFYTPGEPSVKVSIV